MFISNLSRSKITRFAGAAAFAYAIGLGAVALYHARPEPASKPEVTTIAPWYSDVDEDITAGPGKNNDILGSLNSGIHPFRKGPDDKDVIASYGNEIILPHLSDPKKNKDYAKLEKTLSQQLFTEPSQFKVPNSLAYKTPTTVIFVLETAGPGSGSETLRAVAGTATQQSFLVSSQVRAQLSGAKDNVKIELRDGAEIKMITAAGLPTWTWDVTNLDGNPTNLTLTISTTVKEGDPPIFLKSMLASIPVHVTAWDWISINSAAVAQLWGAAAAFGGAAGAVLRFFGKGGQSDKPDKPDSSGSAPGTAAAPAGT